MQGGDRFQQREQLASQVATEEGRISILELQLRQLASGALPLQLVAPLLTSIREEAARKNHSMDARTKKALRQELQKLAKWVDKRTFAKSIKAELHEYVRTAESRLSENSSAVDDKLHWERLGTRLENLVTAGLGEACDAAAALISATCRQWRETPCAAGASFAGSGAGTARRNPPSAGRCGSHCINVNR